MKLLSSDETLLSSLRLFIRAIRTRRRDHLGPGLGKWWAGSRNSRLRVEKLLAQGREILAGSSLPLSPPLRQERAGPRNTYSCGVRTRPRSTHRRNLRIKKVTENRKNTSNLTRPFTLVDQGGRICLGGSSGEAFAPPHPPH